MSGLKDIDTGLHYPIKLCNLPQSWAAEYSGFFCLAIQSGFACGRHSSDDIGITHVRPYNISRDGNLDLSERKFVPVDYDVKRLSIDDVLFNNTNSPELIGKTTLITKRADGLAFSNHMTKLVFSQYVNPQFAAYQLHFLWMARYYLHKCVKHVNQASISSQEFGRTIPFIFPPTNEQHRIVAKIEELFSEIDKGVESLKTAKAQLQVYRQALLKHAFEGKLTAQWRSNNSDKVVPAEELLRSIEQAREERYQQQLTDWQTAVEKWEFNGKEGKSPSKPRKNKLEDKIDSSPYFLPPGWLWLQLGNSNVHISDGPFGSNLKTEDYVEEGIRLIRLENIGRGFFIGEKKTHITLAKYEYLKKHSLQPSDLVLSSFITDLIRVAEIPSDLKISINKSDCFQIRLFGNTIDVKYLLYGLQINSVYKQLEKFVHGVGRPRINTTQLKNVQIPVCSPEEQQELVKLLNAAMSYINATEKSIEADLNKSDILRQSILKKAFSGQLVPQDPNDEPASELLKRIQAEKAQRETTPKTKRKSTNLPRQLTVLRDI
jgi:type I restriction enzyme, S subunit